ncbi:putative FAD-linked oxidoreductase [Defluviimonas aquaemixtae]|uniref:Putative FAD-linked oxidoreductase n=1 Tax=Albidovulum aquaemixtae TaxID=1542388 RepID=A0A2R8BL94_9RHOB|nr:FAD-binding protein [Defluviimonas aquaemixtae]SPH24158.1 putative FAD-linked oxidoreductase [Defluviimonas aquaemixtae]
MRAGSEEEVAEAIRVARGPFRIMGGGTRPVGRTVTGDGLDVSGIAGITLYESGALTVVAKTGTPLADLEAALAAEGQRLAFEPADWRGLLGTEGEPTVGGMVAANVSGPRRVQAGACRDALLGVRFVDGTGAVVKNGGRVMKNVTGYDLVKLMAGSWGTLGVLTEVSLKVLPAHEATAVLVIDGLSGGEALAAMTKALRSPFDVTGAAHGPMGTLIRVEGFAGSVAYRAERLRALLAPFGAVRVESAPEPCHSLWRAVRDVEPFHGTPGDVWRLSVKPSDGPELVRRAKAREAILDWGGGLVWLLMPEGEDLRARLGAFSGHATLLRASEETRARIAPFQPEPAPVTAISAGLRARFDPKGILNPGLMG